MGLRLFSYGHDYPLFVPVESHDQYLQVNPQILNRYFSNKSQTPPISPDPFIFLKDKPQDSFRIIVQGGSTAAGFPLGQDSSIAGMIRQRLKRLFPDKNIEVISTAMAAVNSYTLLDFTDEITQITPDLVLIYAGHNEFLGIMGAGSVFASKGGRPATLMFLKLKELRLFQLMQQVIGFFQSDNQTETEGSSSAESTGKRNIMAQVASGKKIPINSDTFNQGLEQFSGNLDLILKVYQEKGIPVYISTLVSNEKDQRPFASSTEKDNADSFFAEAKQLEQSENYQQAKDNYIKAIDHDLLRFRAPSQFNEIIRNKASRSGVTLVDAEEVLRNDTLNGIIGHAHMYEHLHPTARGYFLLAESFAQTIVENQIIATNPKNFSSRDAWYDIPVTNVEKIMADFNIRSLTSDFPFTDSPQAVEFGPINSFEKKMAYQLMNGADWLETHRALLQHYYEARQDKKAAKVAAKMADRYPHFADLAFVAGEIYFQNRESEMALYYHRKAIELAPKNTEYLMKAAMTFFANNMPEKTLDMLNRVLEIEPDNNKAAMQKNRLLEVMKR